PPPTPPPLAADHSYAAWCRHHDASAEELARQREVATAARHPVRIRPVIVPAGVADPELAARTRASLVSQSWPHWHPGDAAADFVVWLTPGDSLAPDCLYHLAMAAGADPDVDLVHWDDDLAAAEADRHRPRFRPSWSPETLAANDYLAGALALRRSRLAGMSDQAIAGLTPPALHEAVLGLDLAAAEVARIPRVLAHRRFRHDTPTSRRAPPVGHPPHVSIVIPTRHNRPLVERCLAALETTDYPSFDVTVVDSGQATPENRHWWDARTSGLDLSVQWWERPFNWSAVNNRAVATARGDVLVFLNDDTEVLDRSWLLEMVGWAVQPGIGVVGLQLTGTDGRLQSAGTVLGLTGFAGHLFEGARPGDDTLLGPTSWYRNVLAATGACLAVRRTVFSRLDGFDERFELCGSDVAFGLAAHRAGWRNLCSPFAALRHLGSATRGPDVPEADFHTSFWPYQPWLFGGDPYFSPNLSFTEPVPALRWPG
ncbi:MAG: glycosyltransferase, partial [Acidimicrobiales bacterium]